MCLETSIEYHDLCTCNSLLSPFNYLLQQKVHHNYTHTLQPQHHVVLLLARHCLQLLPPFHYAHAGGGLHIPKHQISGEVAQR